ncbi:enoyl-CoA hydratase-related protein [Gemmatimonadota bacterium]
MTGGVRGRFHATMGLERRTDDEGILWLVFTPEGRRPPLMTREVFAGLQAAVEGAAEHPPTGIVFMAESGGDFQAGVDLDELAALGDEDRAYRGARTGQLLFQAVADLKVPTVAAIEGRCLGGGTELALACDARLAAADSDTAIALPEVHLGLMPGFGGTQRLPRLIGQRRALNMILTGQAVRADRALQWGLVDRLVPSERLSLEAASTVRLLREGRFRARGPRLWWRPWELVFEGIRPGRRAVRARYFRIIRKRTKGRFPAPELALQAVGMAADRVPLSEGLDREARLFASLTAGPVHAHLLNFMRSRQALRRPRSPGDSSSESVSAGDPGGTPLRFPDTVTARLETLLGTAPGAHGDPTPPSDLPLMEISEGVGIVRRLPATRPPLVAEVTWTTAAGAPVGFEESARCLLVAAGITPVWCCPAEPSPGLSLLAAYLREGDRLAAEGLAPTAVDRIMREWGMSAGPFSMADRLGPGWNRRIRSLPTRTLPVAVSQAELPHSSGTGDEADRMVDEVVAVLALEMARIWNSVAEPVEAGWSVLDVFVLGAPAYRGGILGEARSRGEQNVVTTLTGIQERWGPRYAPAELMERGLLKPNPASSSRGTR